MAESEHSKTHAAVTGDGSALERYQRVIVGRPGWLRLIYFEICTLLSPVPGALGLALRGLFWPPLFAECGQGTLFGANVSLRHPHRIALGARLVISDGCILDARNEETDTAIRIDDDTTLSNNVMISCKNGTVQIGRRAGLGAQTVIHAVNGCSVEIGDHFLAGPSCYLAGGGNYRTDRRDVPIVDQGLREEEEGVTVESDVWLGARVVLLPGVTMAKGSVAAAGAVVSRPIPRGAVCAGVPARVVRMRGEISTPSADTTAGRG